MNTNKQINMLTILMLFSISNSFCMKRVNGSSEFILAYARASDGDYVRLKSAVESNDLQKVKTFIDMYNDSIMSFVEIDYLASIINERRADDKISTFLFNKKLESLIGCGEKCLKDIKELIGKCLTKPDITFEVEKLAKNKGGEVFKVISEYKKKDVRGPRREKYEDIKIIIQDNKK